MPRLARQYQTEKSFIFHLLNRGILCQTIFHDDEDAAYFLQQIKRYKERNSFLVYHWCLMPNHYHLVAEFFQPRLISKVIGACQQIYARYYHRKYHTAGKLFQNRFKSQAIEKQTYLLACGRYVELNPVRARLVKQAWDWKWSSARFYVQYGDDCITSPDPEWQGENPRMYQQWLSDTHAAQLEQAIFVSNAGVIGKNEFKKGVVVKAGLPLPRHYARSKRKIKNNEL